MITYGDVEYIAQNLDRMLHKNQPESLNNVDQKLAGIAVCDICQSHMVVHYRMMVSYAKLATRMTRP